MLTPRTKRKGLLRDERGQSLAFVAVLLLGILAVLALALDLGMLLVARAEAQRVADSSSLAGASAFIDYPRIVAKDTAEPRAIAWANQNYVRNTSVPSADVRVWVIPDSEKVRVAVRRQNLGLWWAKVFGQLLGEVSAVAAAQAVPASGAKCVWPFALPDMWQETDTTNPLQDADGDQIFDPTEEWDYDTITGDVWKPRNKNFPDDPTTTGFGSQFRHNLGSVAPYDYGMLMTIKAQKPSTAITPPFFMVWRIPGNTGANDARDSIERCANDTTVVLNQPYDIEPGNQLGPIKKAVNDVYDRDSLAVWDPINNVVVGSQFTPWTASPRLFKAGIFPPTQVNSVAFGTQTVAFSDFGLFWLDGFWGNGNQAPVTARFIGFASGTSVGGPTGSLLKILRLVE